MYFNRNYLGISPRNVFRLVLTINSEFSEILTRERCNGKTERLQLGRRRVRKCYWVVLQFSVLAARLILFFSSEK